MRDSIGSSVVIVIIVVFIVFAMSYLAFNVNYTKAFRMKNKIISLYKEYNGDCTDNCKSEIKNYAEKIGYKPSRRLRCPPCSVSSNYTVGNDLYYCSCQYHITDKTKTSDIQDLGDRYYFHIITRINMDIPIIGNMIDLEVFNISGDTEVFVKN